MRMVINPANYLWSQKGAEEEGALYMKKFMEIFDSQRYLHLLMDDFASVIRDYELLYQKLFDDTMSEIENADANNE